MKNTLLLLLSLSGLAALGGAGVSFRPAESNSFSYHKLLPQDTLHSQSVVQVKCKDYKGYIFPKEHSIWGLTPEYNRYTPSIEDIAQAEKILRTFVRKGYINTNKDGCCKVPINKRALKKYMRQYVGYLTESGSIIIHIFLNKDIDMDKNNLSEDIMAVFDGGINHWSIKINISTKELFDLQINGIS